LASASAASASAAVRICEPFAEGFADGGYVVHDQNGFGRVTHQRRSIAASPPYTLSERDRVNTNHENTKDEKAKKTNTNHENTRDEKAKKTKAAKAGENRLRCADTAAALRRSPNSLFRFFVYRGSVRIVFTKDVTA
jgi:hypothetical protein